MEQTYYGCPATVIREENPPMSPSVRLSMLAVVLKKELEQLELSTGELTIRHTLFRIKKTLSDTSFMPQLEDLFAECRIVLADVEKYNKTRWQLLASM